MGTSPENSLEGIAGALLDGVDAIEVDVRASRDGVAMLLHDATLARTHGDARPLEMLTATEARALGVPTLDDALAAYRWLLEQGTAAADLAIAGDSAGGGLSVATLVALRDCKQPLPAAAAMLSPWVDLSCSGATMETRAHLDPIVHKQMTALMGSLYLSGADPTNPLASPIHASLTGLPPLLVQVGGRETLWDDSMRLVANARRDGVDVTLETEEDMIHVWQIFPSRLLEARQAIERIGVFVKRHLR